MYATDLDQIFGYIEESSRQVKYSFDPTSTKIATLISMCTAALSGLRYGEFSDNDLMG